MFLCRTRRLANYLMNNGATMKRIDKSKYDPHFLVFMFERNDILHNCLEKWKLDKNTYFCD